MKNALKILLVDDDQDFLDVLGLLFEMDGADTHYAHNYNEALDLLERELFDIVVTDYRMPRMHGLYLLDMIKDKNPDMPVIVVSAFGTDEFIEQAKRKKADLILRKPFDYSELLAGISRLMKKKWQKQSGTKQR